jgi:hypothetical protein
METFKFTVPEPSLTEAESRNRKVNLLSLIAWVNAIVGIIPVIFFFGLKAYIGSTGDEASRWAMIPFVVTWVPTAGVTWLIGFGLIIRARLKKEKYKRSILLLNQSPIILVLLVFTLDKLIS